MDHQDSTQLLESDLNDFQPMPRNLFFRIPVEARRRHSRQNISRPERPLEAARTTELEERTRVLEMTMGKILSCLIPDDSLIPLLNRGEQPAAVVATRNSPALSNVVVPTKPRGSGRLNPEPSSSKHSDELMKKNAKLEKYAPLNQSITAKPYQEGFKIPHLETYGGSGDSDEHLHTYQAIMKIQNAIDAMMCKVFPATLKSTARRWYHKLPRHSIASYSQLATLFSNNFVSQREIMRTAIELMQVHQREGESLRDYMQRFNKATLDIDNVLNTICLSALLDGLKPGRFLDNLLENPPKSWNESKEHKQPEGREEKKKKKVGEQRGKPPSFPRYANYLPLSSSRNPTPGNPIRPTLCKNIPDLRGKGISSATIKISSTTIKIPTRGVSTHLNLAEPIEDVHLTSEDRDKKTSSQNQKDHRGVGYNGIPSPSGTINMISGGMHSGGQSA
ncbi:hypothetical protein SLEP1_g8732 [Rubroshorea leprosula]|uniref:Retrotransposon gag domain-containing protein n=1 Tax=Rubroshorea leprosula TaxID=152421 RepID=A0AAV5IDK8_9ROSI|nr:hypothetical protein SLEP1_g8732 [Rubroshorea leprosula]